MDKHIGHTLEIIYLDKAGKLSQRKIEVRSVSGDKLSAYCLERKELRTFNADNILASHRVVAAGRVVRERQIIYPVSGHYEGRKLQVVIDA
ncbi:hypothetical protein [Paenibacillus eucommiae]|uniref:DNA-binding transcriptional regulator YafY n=1 Tax=Paenibacillus eucommiae TaxID=1355755 RepID=A0ABS4J192_9BACL|nr:hypothetical protein [Paenibacillus eucommiae]MBP1992564.1 putative DNA-binding transcriptional regulator YafY [Paenibacillus eucommiae]